MPDLTNNQLLDAMRQEFATKAASTEHHLKILEGVSSLNASD
jgi:hypothetical protein